MQTNTMKVVLKASVKDTSDITLYIDAATPAPLVIFHKDICYKFSKGGNLCWIYKPVPFFVAGGRSHAHFDKDGTLLTGKRILHEETLVDTASKTVAKKLQNDTKHFLQQTEEDKSSEKR